MRKTLLICGILSSLLYILINILVPMQWREYSPAAQTVSELSAIGAPTRTLWNWLCAPYTLLVILFAFGVRQSSEANRRLRIAGGLLIVYGALGLLWPFAPMHQREDLAAGGASMSDTFHIALGVVTEILFLLALAFAGSALNKRFRVYSIISFLVLLIFGSLTFRDAPLIALNKPTPFIGVWERINIGIFLVWVIVLASILIRQYDSRWKMAVSKL